MFNKGKPYVPPPTRAMGSTHPHDDLHSIDDELELEAQFTDDGTLDIQTTSYSHASEERGEVDHILSSSEETEQPAASYGVISAGAPEDAPTVSASTDSPTGSAGASYGDAGIASGNTSGSGSGGGTGGGSGGGWSGGSGGGGYRGNPPSRPSREASSVLGNGMTFEGDISGVGQLVVEGIIKGDVRVSNVLINENGSVEGTVHADVLEVRGKVTGAIIAKQVHLHTSSRVEGDITQEQLTVDRGAWFSGRSTQARRDGDLSQSED